MQQLVERGRSLDRAAVQCRCRPRSPSSSAGSPIASTTSRTGSRRSPSRSASPPRRSVEGAVAGGEEGASRATSTDTPAAASTAAAPAKKSAAKKSAGEEGCCEEGAREEGCREEGPGEEGAGQDAGRRAVPGSRRSRPRRPRSAEHVSRRLRLDAELVRRGLVPSRTEAGRVIDLHRVLVNGAIADKASRLVDPGDAVVVTGEPPRFVSRGGEKLDAALDAFGLDVGRRRRARRRCVHRRVHRLPAAARAPPTWWHSTSATASCTRGSATTTGSP